MDVQPVGGAPAAPVTPQTDARESRPIEPATVNGEGDANKPLSSTIAKLFAGAVSDGSAALHVSYRVEKPDEVITVFSDPVTGHEVAQFPAEAMVQIAQFFDKSTGVTLDQNA